MTTTTCLKCGAVLDAELAAKAAALTPPALQKEIDKADLNVRKAQAGVAIDGGIHAADMAIRTLTHAQAHPKHVLKGEAPKVTVKTAKTSK